MLTSLCARNLRRDLSVRDGSVFAELPECRATGLETPIFLSATRQHVERLDADHWRAWLTSPQDFKGALERAAPLLPNGCYLIETGAHPVLTALATDTLGVCGVRVLGGSRVGAGLNATEQFGMGLEMNGDMDMDGDVVWGLWTVLYGCLVLEKRSSVILS